MVRLFSFGRCMQDCPDFNDKSGHHHDRSERETQETKAMLFAVYRHDDESDDQHNQSDDHQLIVLFSEGEFMFHDMYCQYKLSNDILRYLLMEK
jgi:hypothetical protein